MVQVCLSLSYLLTVVIVSHTTTVRAASQSHPRLYPRKSGVHWKADWDPKATPYPSARLDDISFSYQSAAAHGNVTIADPYNYLEKSGSSSKEVQGFIDQQNSFFKTYLQKIKDTDAIRASIKDAGHYDELSYPEAFGSSDNPLYVYTHKELGSDLKGLYVATQAQIVQATKDKFSPLPGKKVLDESSLDKDVLIFDQNISPDGKTLLYRLQKRGTNDLVTVRLLDISGIHDGNDAKSYPDQITGNQDILDGWTSDSKGFFYVHETLKEDGSFDKSSFMYHTVGTDVKDDIVFLKPSTSKGLDLTYSFDVTTDRKVLIVYAFGDTGKPLLYATTLDQPLSEPRKWISISPEFDIELDYLTNVGNEYYFLARYDNESNQVIKFKLDFTKVRQVSQLSELKDKATLEPTVIPEDKNALIDIYTIFDNDKMLLCYTEDAQRKCFIYELQTGKLVQSILTDQIGSSSSLASLTTGSEIFFWSWAYNTPGQLYYIKWDKGQKHATSELVYEAKLQSIDAKEYTVSLNWAISKDSTKVPFYLFHRKGINFDGTRPIILNFYGAYRVIWLPYYSPTFMSWVRDYDAIFAFAYPRGGGEVKAEQWHLAGTKANKQNTIDDINAVVQYLIDNKITAKGKIIIYGQYAGSTTTMAMVNQAAEGNLGVVTLQNGMFDLLRFPISPSHITSELEEYGSPSRPEDFDWLRKISPLHNVDQKKDYPAMLFLPGDDSDSQWHGRKMVATLQHDLANNSNPFFYSTYDSKLSDEENSNNDPVFSIAFAAHVLGLQRVNH